MRVFRLKDAKRRLPGAMFRMNFRRHLQWFLRGSLQNASFCQPNPFVILLAYLFISSYSSSR